MKLQFPKCCAWMGSLPKLTKLMTMSASFKKLLSCRLANGGPWVVKTGLYG